MEIQGKVHEITPVENVTETFRRRVIILEYAENPQYPEYIKLEALQDKVGILDTINVGDHVEASFNLRGRPWTDRNGKTSYFNSLVVWKIKALSAAPQPDYVPPMDISSAPQDDDLPF